MKGNDLKKQLMRDLYDAAVLAAKNREGENARALIAAMRELGDLKFADGVK